jgi:hypothetical protein
VENIAQYMKNTTLIRKIIAENMQNNSMWLREKIQTMPW